MFRYLLVLAFLLPAGFAAGQGWERVFDGGGAGQINDIVQTPDGGFLMVGYYDGISRAHLLKTDADGFQQWTKDYFLAANTSAEALILAEDGGYILVGFLQDIGMPRKAYLMKTDALGTVLWTAVYPGNGHDAEALDVVELPGENAYVVSGFQKTNDIDEAEDVLVFKVNADGAIVWSNSYGAKNIQEKGYAIAADITGNLLVAGERRQGPSDMYVIHILSASGISDWEKTYGFFLDVNDVARDIQVTPDGGFVLAGQTNYIQGAAGFLLKIDGIDNNIAVWQATFPKADFYGLTMAKDGGFFVTGSKTFTALQEELFIARTDAEGNSFVKYPSAGQASTAAMAWWQPPTAGLWRRVPANFSSVPPPAKACTW
ncbi:MAG: hypothetical protein IPH12_19605 [Saprospirales bacterium]|nr:hypothetical protein [Saprospirales bacterium]